LFILNLMLPKRGGLQLLEAIRADVRHKNTPVMALSNTYLPDLSQKALKAGGKCGVVAVGMHFHRVYLISRELVGIDNVAGQPPMSSDQLTKQVMEEGAAEAATIRQHFLRFSHLPKSAEGQQLLGHAYQTVRALSTRAGLAGLHQDRSIVRGHRSDDIRAGVARRGFLRRRFKR
jgi:CheY-like chemotaxis protein